ncbi:DNA-dependent protein kinase subunit [Cavenderia fasciculata]|uniref:DNA-dependent protein kinase catalytic subunit n=1 Tax=Cavenderia fasciculata TaxID=261658 RepID=F4QCR8_CACFS|nr:DNA-dependent protein kinase subunit [Cavenderia fasciculata]EGG13650.1 DNA-dependent protein kinase subunit [Cavenderia fasciculata]|eukprot:XP_004350354.1 DNA-dependent protein kinase subunit [Cavenderia fasciculata]
MKRVYSLAMHPASNQRLGAAIALTEIYRIFREEETLVTQFIFELMHMVLLSLRISSSSSSIRGAGEGGDKGDDDGAASSENDEIANKLSHVLTVMVKVIERKLDILNKSNAQRREHTDLQAFVLWLFKECCGRTESRARTEAILLFQRLVVMLPGIKSGSQWIKDNIKKHGIGFIMEVAEPANSLSPPTGSKKSGGSAPTVAEIEFWFKHLQTSLHVYTWYLSESFIEPIHLVNKEYGSKILTNSFYIFLSEYANNNSNSTTNNSSPISTLLSPLSPRELEKYNFYKFKFIDILNYGGIQFIRLVGDLLLTPLAIGLTEIDLETGVAPQQGQAFPGVHPIVNRICAILIEQGDRYKDTLIQVLVDKITSNDSALNLVNIDKLIKNESIDTLITLVKGYKIIHNNRVLDDVIEQCALATKSTIIKSTKQLNELLVDYIFDNCSDQVSPSKLLVFKEILTLVFSIGISPQKLLSLIQNPASLQEKSKDKKDINNNNNNNNNNKDDKSKNGDGDVTMTTTTPQAAGGGGSDTPPLEQVDKYSLFYKTFFGEITKHISSHFESYVDHLVEQIKKTNGIHKLLNDICIFKHTQWTENQSSLRKKEMKTVLIPFLTKVSSILSNNDMKQEEKENILEFVKNFIKVDTTTFFESQEGYDFIYSMLVNYLNRSNTLAFKNKALTLLPYLLSYPKHHNYNSLKEKLNEIVVYNFPLVSKDLTVGSPIYNDYITTIDRFLDTLESKGSTFMIDTLLPILKERDHSYIVNINASIDRFIKGSSDEQSKEVFTHCFNVFLSNDYTDELKITLVDKFCTPLIAKMTQPSLIHLFTLHLTSLMSIIQPLVPKYMTNSGERKSSIIEKICCFHVIEAFYEAMPSTTIKDNVNRYFYDKPDAKGTELTAAIMRAAHSAKSEKLASDDKHVTRPLCTLYHGSAYSCLASVIAATQSRENFFHTFFFKENIEKNEYLWENIIDTEKVYNFEPETNFTVNSKVDMNSIARRNLQDIKYLSSQYLQDSSLSQDASISGRGAFIAPAPVGHPLATFDDIMYQQQQRKYAKLNENMEMDEINSNPSMLPMLHIIDIYQDKFKLDSNSNEMPKWMTELYNKAKDSLLINRPQYFEKYHRQWIPLLIDYVISPATGGKGFHYFIRDVCLIILKWPNIYSLENQKSYNSIIQSNISRFINYLFKNAYAANRQIHRNNLNIIKLFVERWKGIFTVDKKNSIVEYLSHQTSGNFKGKGRQYKTTGLVLLSILLSNDIPAYDKQNDSDINEFKFYQTLLDNLTDFKELSDATSEICGMMLNFNQKHQNQSDLNELLRGKILSLFASTDYQRAFNCLYFIGLHHPSFLKQFQVRMLNVLPQLNEQVRLIAFNILYWIGDEVDDLYIKLKSINLENLIRVRNEENQLILLKILFKIVKNQSTQPAITTQIVQLLLKDYSFNSNPNESCRDLYFEICMWIYNNVAEYSDSDQLRITLLIGLSDDSEAIKKKIMEFWDTNQQLSLSTSSRLLQIFEKMYSVETENQWLGYSCCLLFQLCSRSSDFSKLVFEKPLSECTFKEYQLDSSWQSRTSNMNPLFSSSQDDSASQMMMMDTDQGIRSTQAPQFTLTQSSFSQFYPSGNSSLSQDVDMITGSNYSQQHSQQQQQKKQLPKPTSSSGKPSAGQKGGSGAFKQPAPVDGKYMELRNRFKKNEGNNTNESSANANVFARMQVKFNKEREAYIERAKKARENQVTMFRKYRSGELPDIQIKLQEIVRPLQLLCQIDSTIGSNVFASLFTAIYGRAATETKGFRENIKERISSISSVSVHCYPQMVSCILRIVEQCPELAPTCAQLARISLYSGNHPLGIVVLEQQIQAMINKEMSSSGSRRRQTSNSVVPQSSELSDAWEHLRELYRAMNENDILLGLIERQMGNVSYTKDAMEAELRGDWVSVLKVYDQALGALESGQLQNYQLSQRETSLWENGRLECYTKLRDLAALRDNFISYFGSDDSQQGHSQQGQQNNNAVLAANVFTESNREQLLTYYLQYSLKAKENWPALYQFISSLTPEQYEYIESTFPGELAFLEITRSDYNKSHYYIQKFYQRFREKWASTHPLAISSRHRLLQPIQKMIEIEEFLSLVHPKSTFSSSGSTDTDMTKLFMKGLMADKVVTPGRTFVSKDELATNVANSALNIKHMESLVNLWKKRYPSRLDDVVVWDDVVSYRSVLLEKIYERFMSSQNDEHIESSIKNLLIQERAELYHQMSKGARKLGNIIVSESYFRLAVKSYPKTKENDLAFPLVSSLIKIYCLKAKNSSTPQECLDRFVKALKFVVSKSNEETIKQSIDNQQKYERLHGDILWELYQLEGQLGADVVQDSLKKNSMSIPSLSLAPAAKVSSELFNMAYRCYNDSIQLHTKQQQSNNSVSKGAYLQFANFCDNVLAQRTNANEKSDEASVLASSVVNAALTAIKEEIPGAIEKFPRLLEIISQYESTANDFKENIKTIPCWMFIRWMSQIFPYLDLPQGPLVISILVKIAQYYPQAIYFPYKISSEQFGRIGQKVSQPLDLILKDSLLDTFTLELERLTHPEHRFKDYMETVKQILKQTPIDTSSLVKLNTEIYNDCFNHKTVSGDYNKKFSKEWEAIYIGHFGIDGSKLIKMDGRKFVEVVTDMTIKMNKNMKPTSTASMKLKDFSSWLAEFDKSNYLNNIEIPGQYNGYGKPQPELHIKVSSFDANILVMGSLRKPKRVKIHGSDEQNYPFLVKGGEDLRLDQRVQQLFHVMNDIMAKDTATSQRNLKIATYHVVPMTSKVGIIQWLLDTKPLKEILEEQMAIHQKVDRSQVSLSRMEASKIHSDWIQTFAKYLKTSGPPPPGPLYHQMFIHATAKDAIDKQERQHARIPATLLQKGIWSLAASPEAYLFIRSSFARSLATFSIGSYVIGIGDRHLENFLISQRNGILIGIDFGHAFGTATQFLPIPELMPFRLTRQFTSFLKPLDAVGLLAHTMTHTLNALQNHKDFLLSTMDVFVKEPLIDWVKLASRLGKEMGADKNTDEWFPKKKIAIAKKKLDRWNPAYITTEEILSSVHKGQIYEKNLLEITHGDQNTNIRSKTPKICKSAKEQVDCLIDQATDLNILGRTWAGWSSWL